MTSRKGSRRNKFAAELRDPKYKPRRTSVKKTYNRKKMKHEDNRSSLDVDVGLSDLRFDRGEDR